MTEDTDQSKIDFRVYIGMIFFRWQIIAVCFLYALLGGVLYINLAPQMYLTKYKIMIYREAKLEVSAPSTLGQSSFNSQMYILQSPAIRGQVAQDLWEKWSDKIGGRDKMMLSVVVDQDKKIGSTLNVSVTCSNPRYAEDFLKKLVEIHQREWEKIQKNASSALGQMLEDELARLEEKIKAAEDEMIEYQRVNEIARLEAKSTTESRYLMALMERKNELTTELMMIEAEHPALKDVSVGVISDVASITRETGAVKAAPEYEKEARSAESSGIGGGIEADEPAAISKPRLPASLSPDPGRKASEADDTGWRELRVSLARLQQKEKELAAKFKT